MKVGCSMPWESGNDIAVRIIEVCLLLRSKEGNKAWRLFVITGLREKRGEFSIEQKSEIRGWERLVIVY